MISAKEAREALNSKLNVKMEADLRIIEDLINKAVAKDRDQITVDSLSDNVATKLRALGYNINRGKEYDQRQGEYDKGYVISW